MAITQWLPQLLEASGGEVRFGPDADEVAVYGRFANGRVQQARVTRLRVAPDDEWVEVSAPVCRENELSPRDAVLRNRAVIGHLWLVPDAGLYVLRHTLQLEHLDPPFRQLEVVLAWLLNIADNIELEVTGGDLW